MKIYLDVCCFCRPFDERNNIRVQLESDAMIEIFARCERGEWSLLNSPIVQYEIDRIQDFVKRGNVIVTLSLARTMIQVTAEIVVRAKTFERVGVKAFDALHLALAEQSTDIFLTVDDKLLRRAKLISDLKITIDNPLHWMEKIV